MMNARGWRLGRQYTQFFFMASVTAVLLALVADLTRYGMRELPAILAYAFAAGFGLEFVSASWRAIVPGRC